jgi:tetratricopeptide (TPR) repeat protein
MDAWRQAKVPSSRSALRAGQVEALIALMHEERYRDLRRMLDLGFWAVMTAKSLIRFGYEPRWSADVCARAWAELGNAHRLQPALQAADVAFSRALASLDEGTGDLFVAAQVSDLLASLRKDQRQLSEAHSLLARVVPIYRRLGQHHLAGRALIKRATCAYYDGDVARAARWTDEGFPLIDAEREPQLVALAEKNRLLYLTAAGRHAEAAKLFREVGDRLRERFENEPLNLLRLEWIEGKILAGTGHLNDAENVFHGVRAGFAAQAQHYNTALLALELAGVNLWRGDWLASQRLALEAQRAFESLGIHPKAVHAAAYLETACRQ